MEYQNENFNGEYDFRSRFHDGWHMKANLHEYSELLYCKKGNGYAIVNGKSIFIKENEMIWIPPNYVHQYDFDSAEVICAVFSNDFIPLFFKEVGNRYFCVSALNVEKISHILERLPNMSNESALYICGYLNSICAAVMEQSNFEERGCDDGILYQKVISYISDNYCQNITLLQISKEFGYNTKYLSHVLHTLTGIHFKHLVNFYRINHAKNLLENFKDRNITEVAISSGFGALNTFNREFKRATGMTPSEYKRMFS